MKIVYWSPVHGQAGTTSNMLISALIAGILYKKKCLLMHTHFMLNNLEAPLVGSNAKNAGSSGYFQDVGLDALIRSFKAGKLTKEDLENCCISIPNTKVSLLPGTSKSNQVSFEYEMDMVIRKLLRAMEELVDIVFIDVCSGNHPLSHKILESSDVIVINLSQNTGLMESCLSSYPNLIKKKVFYLIGCYDGNSKYNISNIRRHYRRYIKNGNSGVIPYNTSFRDALCDGRVAEFVKDNLGCGKYDENLFFIEEAKKVTEKIGKLAGIKIAVEESKERNELSTW